MGSVRVSGLGKAYKLYPTRWSRLLEWLHPGAGPRHQLCHVLQDIGFEVEPGEAIGIIGLNGAGKSTLLKIITGTTQATRGNIEIGGRVAALLELGMGFHPDFTGRQNAILAGQLQGLDNNEINSLMPVIEAFAEIGDYFDQPVRVYSSGMQMRLAFSVATARRPDILIVDEALSVGDSFFQHKSFNRIRQFREAGTTLLIVSHDRSAIQSICDRVILLHAGRLEKIGDPEEVLDYYHALLANRDKEAIRQERRTDGKALTISGTGAASVRQIVLLDANGERVDAVEVGSEVTLEIKVAVNAPLSRLVLGFMIKDRLGQPMYGINTHRLDMPITDVVVGEEITYHFTFPMNLGKGHYSISTSLSRLDSHLDGNYEWRDLGLLFHVVNTRQVDFVGCAWLQSQLSIERRSPA